MSTLAVIDIGSNTILLTVGEKSSPQKLKILLDQGDVFRLSEGLRDGGPLQPEAKARALEALQHFKKLAQTHGATQIIAAGTAAFRRASDGKEFAKQIETELGIPVKILTGDEEAHYSYQSAKYDFEKKYGTIGVIDIGGGSTEFVFGENGPHFSLPIGTVRLTEKYITGHPISEEEWKHVRTAIQSELKALTLAPSPSFPHTWVAVAATPASLAAVLLKLPSYQPERIHGYVMKIGELEKIVEKLRARSMAERIAMPGMDPKRAELLPVGGAILEEVMRFLNLKEILVSDHGLRYGMLLHFAQ